MKDMRARLLLAGFGVMLIASAAYAQTPASGASCEALAKLALPNATITLAESTGGEPSVTPENPRGGAAQSRFANLPAFCRVAATLKPSQDSDIKIEVWLPASGWNGKFQAVGNGGWSGAIAYGPLGEALRHGYAAASTDTGHTGGRGAFALGHPEKLVDFAYRAVHEMTVQAKALIAAFYGKGPRLSYWTGCSSGGKQGLKEAQRFPDDYDGIVSFAPANYWTHLMAGDVWPALATLKDPASYIPPAKYAVIHQAVLDACDALDGVKDGLIEDPSRCRFNPDTLRCAGDEGPTCLTAPQAEAAAKIYAGPSNPRTHESIFPGLAPGSELGWRALAAGPDPFAIVADHFKYVVFKDPAWDFRTLDLDRDVERADALDNVDGGLLNATDPNLTRFTAHGGKLLLFHGWSDQLIAPQNTINYYKRVVETIGVAKATDAVRLFMLPGMAHCSGGEGPGIFDWLSPLEQWVEEGKAPAQIIVSRRVNGVTDRARPICPYPQVAQYKGSGSIDEASSFVCKVP